MSTKSDRALHIQDIMEKEAEFGKTVNKWFGGDENQSIIPPEYLNQDQLQDMDPLNPTDRLAIHAEAKRMGWDPRKLQRALENRRKDRHSGMISRVTANTGTRNAATTALGTAAGGLLGGIFGGKKGAAWGVAVGGLISFLATKFFGDDVKSAWKWFAGKTNEGSIQDDLTKLSAGDPETAKKLDVLQSQIAEGSLQDEKTYREGIRKVVADQKGDLDALAEKYKNNPEILKEINTARKEIKEATSDIKSNEFKHTLDDVNKKIGEHSTAFIPSAKGPMSNTGNLLTGVVGYNAAKGLTDWGIDSITGMNEYAFQDELEAIKKLPPEEQEAAYNKLVDNYKTYGNVKAIAGGSAGMYGARKAPQLVAAAGSKAAQTKAGQAATAKLAELAAKHPKLAGWMKGAAKTVGPAAVIAMVGTGFAQGFTDEELQKELTEKYSSTDSLTNAANLINAGLNPMEAGRAAGTAAKYTTDIAADLASSNFTGSGWDESMMGMSQKDLRAHFRKNNPNARNMSDADLDAMINKRMSSGQNVIDKSKMLAGAALDSVKQGEGVVGSIYTSGYGREDLRNKANEMAGKASTIHTYRQVQDKKIKDQYEAYRKKWLADNPAPKSKWQQFKEDWQKRNPGKKLNHRSRFMYELKNPETPHAPPTNLNQFMTNYRNNLARRQATQMQGKDSPYLYDPAFNQAYHATYDKMPVRQGTWAKDYDTYAHESQKRMKRDEEIRLKAMKHYGHSFDFYDRVQQAYKGDPTAADKFLGGHKGFRNKYINFVNATGRRAPTMQEMRQIKNKGWDAFMNSLPKTQPSVPVKKEPVTQPSVPVKKEQPVTQPSVPVKKEQPPVKKAEEKQMTREEMVERLTKRRGTEVKEDRYPFRGRSK